MVRFEGYGVVLMLILKSKLEVNEGSLRRRKEGKSGGAMEYKKVSEGFIYLAWGRMKC